MPASTHPPTNQPLDSVTPLNLTHQLSPDIRLPHPDHVGICIFIYFPSKIVPLIHLDDLSRGYGTLSRMLILKVAVASTKTWEHYTEAVYFVVITSGQVGYGEIRPTTHSESMFGLLLMLLGCLAYSIFMVRGSLTHSHTHTLTQSHTQQSNVASLATTFGAMEDSQRNEAAFLRRYLRSPLTHSCIHSISQSVTHTLTPLATGLVPIAFRSHWRRR